jgi:hypothetical protein
MTHPREGTRDARDDPGGEQGRKARVFARNPRLDHFM